MTKEVDDKWNYINVAALRRICDPTESNCWGTYSQVTEQLVSVCIEQSILQTSPVHHEEYEDPIRHAARIAFFVEQPAGLEPICVDIGVPELGYTPNWAITDGNHRFFAAIYRGSPVIQAFWSGSVGFAEDLGLLAEIQQGVGR